MKFKIIFLKKAKKELQKIDLIWQKRVVDKLKLLVCDSELLAGSTKKLIGRGSEKYRLRVGNYRVIYAKEKDFLIITIVRIAHRKEVYK